MIKELFKSIFKGFGYTLGKILFFALLLYLFYLIAKSGVFDESLVLPI